MEKHRKNIYVLEPSEIIYEGLVASISKFGVGYSFYHFDKIKDLELLHTQGEASVALINPSIIQNRLAEFQKIKKQNPYIFWIGIIYSFYENTILKHFDDTFAITDDIAGTIDKINKVYIGTSHPQLDDEYLSERETDVLKLLALGLSNKEIADKLSLSIHTINTHRKNIMDKIGVRSVAGLTIYAVSKGVITLD